MSKEIQNNICPECESKYRLIFDLTETSGHPKTCPFCAAEIYIEENGDEQKEGD